MAGNGGVGAEARSLGVDSAVGPLGLLFTAGSMTGLTIGELLERFVSHRPNDEDGNQDASAEAAFTALVERPGRLVFGIYRDMLGDLHDSEDAFQATFLIPARQAGSIRRGDAISGWLHEVARRVVLRTRNQAQLGLARDRLRLAEARINDVTTTHTTSSWSELHEELGRIPEPFRSALILCNLEGHS